MRWALLLGWAWWVGLAPAVQARPVLADPRFEVVADAGAIADNVVSALAVDGTGFVWIGTAVGLVRYDGYEFRPMQPPPDGGYAPNSFVRTLLAGRDGRLWIGTDSEGLAVLEPKRLRWTVYRPGGEGGLSRGTVRALAEDPDGGLWAGTVGGGLQRLDPATRRFTRYGKADGLPDDRIQALWVAPDGALWVGTWNGLARRPARGARFESAPGELGLAGRIVTLLRHDSRGQLWVGTQSGQLMRLAAGGQVQRQLDDGGSGRGGVQTMAEMDDGEIWIGRTGGVEVRHIDDGRLLRTLRYHVSRPWGVAGTDVRAMARDASGVLWVGSYGGGLQRHVPNHGAVWVRRGDGEEHHVLGTADVRSVVELQSGEIWAGTNDRGVAVLDTELRTVAELTPHPGGYRGGRVGAMAQAPDGKVWVASDDGLSVFDGASRRWLFNLPVGQGRVRSLRVVADGTVYAGTQDGLFQLRPGSAGFERLGLADGKPLAGEVNAIVQQSDGRLWLGGERGLFTRDVDGALTPVSIESAATALSLNAVLGLLVDRRNRLWMDTGQGLHLLQRWDGTKAEFDAISPRIGRGGRSFGANLLEDGAGRIWTHRGAYDPAHQQYDELSPADGVDIGTGWFRSYAALRDGRLLFGGSRGMLVVDPARFSPWRYRPPVVASQLRINGEIQPIDRLQPRLRLQPSERAFSLEFAALDLSQPGRNLHRYRLEGVDADWVQSTLSRTATYGGLAPGQYRLQMQGSNRNGQWSPQTLTVEIEVLPDWWQTWWARALAVVLAGCLLWGLVLVRTRSLRRRERWLEASVQERTEQLEEAKRALEASAMTDPLTGMHNRRFATERLDDDQRLLLRRFEEAQRQGQPPPADADLLFFLIDIDHFKQVNDLHGHSAGDAVLAQMRERLGQVFREADYLVRWGGEEFLVVARGSSRAGAPELAERARQAVGDAPFELPGHPPRTLRRTCSIGFACWPLVPERPRATSWATVLNLADAALYLAKREGRDRWVGVLDANGLPAAQLQDGLGEGGELPKGLTLGRSAEPVEPAV